MPVDVVVTVIGSVTNARAVREGGGLVGMRSSANPPGDVPVGFLDWPFMLEEPDLERHLELAERLRPTYAVAPDVEEGRSLEDALAVAERLEAYADTVIVVPKAVPVDAVPRRYRVGLPFREAFDTPLGVNTFFDFQGRPVHVLGGNATDHFAVADRFELDVASVDTPSPLPWADGGRVWVGRRRGADEVDVLVDEGVLDTAALQARGWETPLMLRNSRSARIAFTVRNLLAAWNDPERVVALPRQVEPGRGPPPPAPEGLHGEGREEVAERFEEAVEELEVGRVEREEPAETAPAGLERFGSEGEQEWWRFLQDDADAAAEELVGRDAITGDDERE